MPLKVAPPPFAKPSLGISQSCSLYPHSQLGGPLSTSFLTPPNESTRMLSLLTLIALDELFTFSRALISMISYDQTSCVLVTSPSSAISLTLDIFFPWGIASSKTTTTHKTCHPTSPGFRRFPQTLWISQTRPYFRKLLPVGKKGKVAHTPSANVAGSGPSSDKNAYEALASKSFNYHFGCWKKALAENKGKCMFCHNIARNSDHKTRDCLILKKLGLKLEMQSELDSNIDATLRITALPAAESATPTAATPAPYSNNVSGWASLPGGFSAAAKQDSNNSGDEYNYEGKSSGSICSSSLAKPKTSRT
jgi:hypothetical protein